MKFILKLAIVIASLLFIANVALANGVVPCTCYEVTITPEEGPAFSDLWEICVFEGGTEGVLCSDAAEDCYDLALFGGGPNTPSFDMVPLWTTALIIGDGIEEDVIGINRIEDGGRNGYIWTSGGGLYVYGVGQDDGNRYTAKGRKVDCEGTKPVPPQ